MIMSLLFYQRYKILKLFIEAPQPHINLYIYIYIDFKIK